MTAVRMHILRGQHAGFDTKITYLYMHCSLLPMCIVSIQMTPFSYEMEAAQN